MEKEENKDIINNEDKKPEEKEKKEEKEEIMTRIDYDQLNVEKKVLQLFEEADFV